jgi:hypothetical protein
MKHTSCSLPRIWVAPPWLVLLILLTFSTHYLICEASGLRFLREQQPAPLLSEGESQGNGMAESQSAAKKRFQVHPYQAEKYRQAVAAMSRPMPGAAQSVEQQSNNKLQTTTTGQVQVQARPTVQSRIAHK